MSTTTAQPRTVQVRGRRYPVVLPRLADPRLHIAAVTISLHVLGQTLLGFRVSIPQILVAIIAPAFVEGVRTLWSSKALVWPASAMLTGSGVALIFRVVGTEPGDHWTWEGWHLFALVSVGSLITKYVITYRGAHVFNPSNLGLVLAFVVFGSQRVEPLDLWWAPLTVGMIAAYLVIVAGGMAITARLGLLGMGVAFWVTLAAGLGLLSASGHCMTAAWSAQPVCGAGFWWRVVTSPEVAIFLFFMITDPRTVPRGRSARLVFAVSVAAISTLLMAPQATEFGAKVGLLAGLTLMSPLRFALDRFLDGDSLSRRIATAAGRPLGASALVGRGAVIGTVLVLVAAGVVATGIPARPETGLRGIEVPAVEVSVDLASLPVVDTSEDVSSVLGELTPDELAVMLAENLEIEGVAMSEGETRMLLAADSGQRLVEMERAIDLAVSDGIRVDTTYAFETLAVRLLERDGSQSGAAIAVDATGSATSVRSDVNGGEIDRLSSSLSLTFVMRPGSTGRWLIADSVPFAG